MLKSKRPLRMFLSLLFAVTLVFSMSTVAFSADDEDGSSGVHKDPTTFEKNFDLTPAQKEYTITKINDVVSKITKPEMSDLEKYYRLAVWENRHVKYDNAFWFGTYNFDVYRHQWDTYGVLTDRSVCVGMAIAYAHLCHAADLPCKFARCDPRILDHTISYIPDINDNAYYVDVTENSFLMSEDSEWSFEPIDKAFSNITKFCKDGSFEYYSTYNTSDYSDGDESVGKKDKYDEQTDQDGDKGDNRARLPGNLKDFYKTSYEDWYREYALHDPAVTDKEFADDYVEKGSGLPASDPDYYHASYQDFSKYPAQPYYPRPSNKVTGIWFLDDFYKEPTEVRDTVLNKSFDGEVLDISGLADIYYDCNIADNLEIDVTDDIMVRYFPSAENGKVIAWADSLKTGVDYKVKCTSFNPDKGKATIALIAAGDYNGIYKFDVRIPVSIENAKTVLYKDTFTYNGKVQKPKVKTIKGLSLKAGSDYTMDWSTNNSKNAGTYLVIIDGKGNYSGSTDAIYTIKKAKNPMKLKGKTIQLKKKKLKKKSQNIKRAKAFKVSKAKGKMTYKLVSAKKAGKNFKKKFKINAKTGKITVKKKTKKGLYEVTVKVKATGNANYKASPWKKVAFKVNIK